MGVGVSPEKRQREPEKVPKNGAEPLESRHPPRDDHETYIRKMGCHTDCGEPIALRAAAHDC
jgi:hypothetical protein